MARLSIYVLILSSIFTVVIPSLSSACSDSTSCDSAKVSNQLHEGAKSLRILRSSSADFGWKYHYSDQRALHVTIKLYGSNRWQLREDQNDDERRYTSTFINTGLGFHYIHYFKSESVLTPFVGGGPSLGINVRRYHSESSSNNSSSRNNNIDLIIGFDAVGGYEWRLSDRISLVSEYVVGLIYTMILEDDSVNGSSWNETLLQSAHIMYSLMSLGFAFYLE